jgi:hypothetical protein
MMYSNGLVAVVKSNGKILRENKDEAYLPFGSEYSILIKNLETRKVLVKISIDGADVLDGNSIIINPNSETELEGFMNGSIAKNRFKFIQKTKEISDFRGDRVDDGIIRIEYKFEQIIEKKHIVTEHVHHYYNYYNCNYNCTFCSNWSCPHRKYTIYRWIDNISTGTFSDGVSYDSLMSNESSENFTSANCFATLGNIGSCANNTSSQQVGKISKKSILQEQPIQDEGITVKGSETNQHFKYSNIGPLEDTSRVIVLRLIGAKESGKIVREPITVKTKKQCPTCGKKCKSHMKYCPSCGTFLE